MLQNTVLKDLEKTSDNPAQEAEQQQLRSNQMNTDSAVVIDASPVNELSNKSNRRIDQFSASVYTALSQIPPGSAEAISKFGALNYPLISGNHVEINNAYITQYTAGVMYVTPKCSSNTGNIAELKKQLKYHYQKNEADIKRIFGKPLPISECFVNLVMVHSDHQKKDEQDNLRFYSERLQTYSGYEAVYNTTRKEVIEPVDLFKPRNNKAPRCILITGRAGIGKSILSQYLSVYLWATENEWHNRFDVVIRIQLRNLTKDKYNKNSNISEIVRLECLDRSGLVTVMMQSEIAAILQTISDRTLIILDGWDEFNRRESPCTEIIDNIIKNPNVSIIVLSRPYTELNPKEFDLHLECIGFSKSNIISFINKVCENKSRIPSIIEFLERNLDIYNLAHTPIILDMICAVWEEEVAPDNGHMTMTELYERITNKIWESYKQKQRNIHPTISLAELNKRKEEANRFLSLLAYKGMTNNSIMFSYELIRDAIKETYQCDDDDIGEYLTEILSIGFLNTPNYNQSSGCYYFPHLTFQEYFTALYVSKQFASSADLSDFIKKEKHTPRYSYVFQFISGLLRNNNIINNYIALLVSDPIDYTKLNGFTQVACLLNESRLSNHIVNLTDLLNSIGVALSNILHSKVVFERFYGDADSNTTFDGALISRCRNLFSHSLFQRLIKNILCSCIEYLDSSNEDKSDSVLALRQTIIFITRCHLTDIDYINAIRSIIEEDIIFDVSNDGYKNTFIRSYSRRMNEHVAEVLYPICLNAISQLATNEYLSIIYPKLNSQLTMIKSSAICSLGYVTNKNHHVIYEIVASLYCINDWTSLNRVNVILNQLINKFESSRQRKLFLINLYQNPFPEYLIEAISKRSSTSINAAGTHGCSGSEEPIGVKIESVRNKLLLMIIEDIDIEDEKEIILVAQELLLLFEEDKIKELFSFRFMDVTAITYKIVSAMHNIDRDKAIQLLREYNQDAQFSNEPVTLVSFDNTDQSENDINNYDQSNVINFNTARLDYELSMPEYKIGCIYQEDQLRAFIFKQLNGNEQEILVGLQLYRLLNTKSSNSDVDLLNKVIKNNNRFIAYQAVLVVLEFQIRTHDIVITLKEHISSYDKRLRNVAIKALLSFNEINIMKAIKIIVASCSGTEDGWTEANGLLNQYKIQLNSICLAEILSSKHTKVRSYAKYMINKLKYTRNMEVINVIISNLKSSNHEIRITALEMMAPLSEMHELIYSVLEVDLASNQSESVINAINILSDLKIINRSVYISILAKQMFNNDYFIRERINKLLNEGLFYQWCSSGNHVCRCNKFFLI